MLTFAPTIASSLFRLLAYVFLQIIPSRLIRFAIPAFYAIFLVSTWLFPVPKEKQRDEKHKAVPVRRPNAVATLLFSLPTQSRVLTAANVLINSLLFAAVIDFAASPFFDTAQDVIFTRVGAVYPDSVKVVARYPDHSTLRVLYREVATEPWKDGPDLHLSPDSDWAATARIENLWPSTPYEYVLATANHTVLPVPTAPIPFRTAPDPRLATARRFRFVASSCTVPNFPYRGPHHRRSIHGFDRLADDLALNDTVPTEFMLFLGDFIYADVPFYVGDDVEAYRRLYRRNYQSPSFRRVYERLPVLHAYDDHEFIDNYAGKSVDPPPFGNGAAAYDVYAGNANPDPLAPSASYYTFTHGPAAFFVLDTRRYRAGPTPDGDGTMLGAEQLTALERWVHEVNETAAFKVVVSSVPLTELFTHDAKIDTWAAYPVEKARVLCALQGTKGVVVISGDRHQFAAVEFAGRERVVEVSTSPLSMFYIPLVTGIEYATVDTIQGLDGGEVPRERVLEYIGKGNVKWSAFEVDTRDMAKPVMRIETVIDGVPAYHMELEGMPLRAPAAGLGALVSVNVRGLFDRVGLGPRRWF